MKHVQIESLAAFKRFLAEKGATVELVKHSMLDAKEDKNDKQKAMYDPRTVSKLQTNGVQFSNGSWLYFDSAKRFKFDGHKVIVDLGDEGKFHEVMEYSCYVE